MAVRLFLAIACLLFIAGCAGPDKIASGAARGVADGSDPIAAFLPMWWAAGICSLTGGLTMILTKSGQGIRGVIAGIAMCAATYFLIKYATWVFIPTMIIGIGWSCYHLYQLWAAKRAKSRLGENGMLKPKPQPLGGCGGSSAE
jgi:hypothetical protein